MRSTLFASFDELPSHYDDLLESAGRENFYFSRPWYRNLIETTSHTEDQLVILGVESNDDTAQPVARALMVLRRRGGTRGFLQPRELHLFENVYTMVAGPVLRPGESDTDQIMESLATKIYTELKDIDLIRFGSMDPASPTFTTLQNAF